MDWSTNRDIGENRNDHHLFGYDFPMQGEMQLQCELASKGLDIDLSKYENTRRKELENEANNWKLLLQLDTDDNPGWMWGDAGKLYFWIREEDLKSNNFENVWMVSQGG